MIRPCNSGWKPVRSMDFDVIWPCWFPLDFWREARTALDNIKPLFWLAECEEIMYHEVFDASYTWKMAAYDGITTGKNPATCRVLFRYYIIIVISFRHGSIRAYFTSNHDENSHSGTEYERLGDAALPFAVFCCLYDGLPLIYSGQELPNIKRLLFFDKDEIDWDRTLFTFRFL